MSLFIAVIAGSVTGFGLWMTRRLMRKPTLEELLPPTAERNPGDPPSWKAWVLRAVDAFADRLDWPNERSRKDLAACDYDADAFLRKKTLAVLGGIGGSAFLLGVSTLGASPLDPAVALVLALCPASLGLLVPGMFLRQQAELRRAELRAVTSAIADLVGVALAGGSGVSGALEAATRQGSGLAFVQIRRSLHEAHLRSIPPWDALSGLAQRTGVRELEELAASIRLAGTDGARIRASVAAKAKTLRTYQLAAMEAQAGAATERMSLPILLMVLGVLLLMGVPGVVHVTSPF